MAEPRIERYGKEYMLVPNCKTCAHWKVRVEDNHINSGECTSPDGPWSDCGDYTIFTDSDFGCKYWKAME